MELNETIASLLSSLVDLIFEGFEINSQIFVKSTP